MPLELQIDIRKRPAKPGASATVWYLASSALGDWIELVGEIAPHAQEALRFVPVSDSGVVILGVPGDPAFKRGIPLHAVAGGKILIPMDSGLIFPISAEEAKALVAFDWLLILPGGRQYTFDRDEGYSLADLIAPFPQSQTLWNRAPLDAHPPMSLRSIKVERVADIDDFLNQAKDDIGGTNPDELPRSDDEKSPLDEKLKDLASKPGKSFFQSILKMTDQVPRSEGVPPNWINHLEDWATNQLAKLEQHRELDRLLDLLKNDPDMGLKFALPLSGGADGRGFVPPGGRLGQRDPSFDLSALFGSGGAISPWSVGDDHFWKLQQAYREAANRELSLKRFRRAAYIFGQLLDDLPAAANALEQGGHFAEAAAIYEKKLDQPESAARCYRDGGLFEESLRIYRDLGKQEEMGRLLRELKREDEAINAFTEAISQAAFQDRPIDAARMSLEHFKDETRALAFYRDAWPVSQQAKECLRAEFELLARTDAHDEALERVRDLGSRRWNHQHAKTLLDEFINLRSRYPNQEVVDLSSDVGRVIVGSAFVKDPRAPRSLLDKLSRLDPEDRLLRRDARRFAEQKARLTPPPLPEAGLDGDETVTLVQLGRKDHFPENSVAFAAIAFDNGKAIAKITPGNELFVVYTPAEGLVSRGKWPIPQGLTRQELWSLRLAPVRARSAYGDRAILLTGAASKHFQLDDSVTHPTKNSLAIGHDPGMGEPLALTATEDGQTWKLRRGNEESLVLESSYKGEISASHFLTGTDVSAELDPTRLNMICSRSQIFLTYEAGIFRWLRGKLTPLKLASPATNLATTRNTTLSRIAIGQEDGATVVWGDRLWPQSQDLATDLTNTRVGFTGSNHLIVAGTGKVSVYSVDREKAHLQTSLAVPKLSQPLCIAPGADARTFEIVTQTEIIRFELKRG